ncbi:MAG: type II toxin-antitoxin system death-on-curing family toxin [Clostridiales bacterium]|jgi:death-on-curing protein|nr:type II toxin-antitoxin system death-on-curing family toxin [Clostridiales bacterium]
MIILTVSEVAALHEKIAASTGGLSGVRDAASLESAVLNCYQTFSDEALYPTVTEKAARLAFAICKNHPFVDGNKRAAVAAMLVILRVNNVLLSHTQSELVALGLGIASGSIDYESIVSWIHSRTKGKV